MKAVQKFRSVTVCITLVAMSVFVAVTPSASAATRTITCYKGTIIKKVTTAKCPRGYTLKKPVAKPSTSASPAPIVKPATIAFSGIYTGKISLLWGDSYVQATSVEGIGTGGVLGLTSLTGTGSSSPSNQCDTFNGSGTLSGGGNTLKITFDSSAKACARDADAPTGISFSGNAIINSGTGKYAGATGTLKVTGGSFDIRSTTSGGKESSAFKFSIAGNIVTK